MADNFAVVDATEAVLTFKSSDIDGVHIPAHQRVIAPRIISNSVTFEDFDEGAEPLGESVALYEGVHVLNPSENGVTIWVGGIGINDTTGWPILPGESTHLIRVNDLAYVFIYATQGVVVRYMGF